MFDVGWSELIVIGVVALIVIGPSDLPDMFRQLGRFTAKLKSMSREFTRAMEQAAKESGVSDVAKDLKNATSASSLGLNAVKDAADRFEKWDPIKNAAKPSTPMRPLTPAPMPATIAVATSPAPQATLDQPTVATGPATQALVDKAAAKKAILAETAERLKALDALPDPTPAKTAVKTAAKTAVKPAARTRTKPTVAADIAVDVEPTILAPKTRRVNTTSRKSNKVEDA